ncbi:MAG: maleate cis-trans isomerase family protein [Burkholderiales bacterium]
MNTPIRLGFLVAPGNPTVEPEMHRLAPPEVTVHFDRMVARGKTGSHEGQKERNLSMLAGLDENVELLALVKPAVIVLGHTASSYSLGAEAEAKLVDRLTKASGVPFVTAFGAVLAALKHLGAKRVSLGTPYAPEVTQESKAHLEAQGFKVPAWGQLANVKNIYEETLERAGELTRSVDSPESEVVFLSGTGMPTAGMLEKLERELGKPVISSNSAMMWHALRVAGVKTKVAGYGRLLMS